MVRGRPVPDVTQLNRDEVLARKREVEVQLRATKHDPVRAAERAAARAEYEALDARLSEINATKKRENVRKNFAGIDSPLHDAIIAKFDSATVAELEREALRLLAAREQKSAAAKAAKVAAKAEVEP